MTTDKDVYRPGETATLAIQVSRAEMPQQAAIGVAIVDESVFAIEDQDPGFARTYFLLNRELQEPRYELHNFVDLESDASSLRRHARQREIRRRRCRADCPERSLRPSPRR